MLTMFGLDLHTSKFHLKLCNQVLLGHQHMSKLSEISRPWIKGSRAYLVLVAPMTGALCVNGGHNTREEHQYGGVCSESKHRASLTNVVRWSEICVDNI